MKRLEYFFVALVAIVLGTGMHFVHHAPFFNEFWGYVFPVRESVWEHMKMLLYPLLLLGCYAAFRQKDWRAISGPILITPLAWVVQIVAFYVYWLPVGHEITIIDVIEFVIVMALAVWQGEKWSHHENIRRLWPLAICLAVVMIVAVAILTYTFPEWVLFQDFGD